MTISVPQAAKALGTYSGWTISNLQMQKMLYFAHMFFLGRTGEPLVDENFEAWNYGPVLPSLYKKVRFFGSDNIVDVFSGSSTFPNTPEYNILQEAAQSLAHRPASHLVNITHHQSGAWAKHYRANVRGIKIPNQDILEEYRILYAG